MAASQADLVTKEVFDLYRKYGHQDYIGEPVSQEEHMIQCAMLAEKEGYSDEVVLGVFLHDIGHLIGFHKALPPMGDVGTNAHEIVGEQFLKDLGFPDGVTSFVRGHVDAKRYLVHKYPHYHDEVCLYSPHPTPPPSQVTKGLLCTGLARGRGGGDGVEIGDLKI